MDELRVEVHQTPGEIACNFDEIEAALRNQMQAYESLEITEDNIPERKADVATLRKIKNAVDDERKKVKKTYDEPLKKFEARVKSITGIIDEQIDRINKALDVFEQRRIAEKQAHIQKLYDENIGEYAEYLPLSVIRSEKWNNKTCTDRDIVFDISERVTKVRSDLEAIRAMQSEIAEKCIAAYKAAGNDLAAAVKKNTDYLEAKKAAEERLKAEAEREAREAAQPKNMTVPVTNSGVSEPMGETGFPMHPPTLTIRVTGEENIEALRNFLMFSNISFTEV